MNDNHSLNYHSIPAINEIIIVNYVVLAVATVSLSNLLIKSIYEGLVFFYSTVNGN